MMDIKDYDPLLFNVSHEPFGWLPNTVSNARSNLRSRNSTEILDGIDSINWYIDDYFESIYEDEIDKARRIHSTADSVGVILGEIDDSELDFMIRSDQSDSLTLDICIQQWGNVCGDNLSDATPAEAFSMLSLYHAKKACLFIDKSNQAFDIIKRETNKLEDISTAGINFKYYLCLAADHAAQSSEALHFAESIALKSDYLNLIKSIYHDKEKEKAIKQKRRDGRHKVNDEFKLQIQNEWSKNRSQWPSAEKAAKHFATQLESKGITFEPRTIAKWIRDYAKENNIKLR